MTVLKCSLYNKTFYVKKINRINIFTAFLIYLIFGNFKSRNYIISRSLGYVENETFKRYLKINEIGNLPVYLIDFIFNKQLEFRGY